MKMMPRELELQLKQSKLANAYLLAGEEIILKDEAKTALRAAAKRAGFTERVRIAPEAGFDWDILYTELFAPSLMAERRIVELDFREQLPNKTATPVLQAFAEKPASDVLLIIDLPKLDDKINRSAWFKALDKIAPCITYWPIAREQLPQWISDRAKQKKLALTSDAARLLSDYVEGNLGAGAQLIEKLELLNPPTPINGEAVLTLLADESRFTVFDVAESMIAGDTKRALHQLQQLKADGTESLLVLWAITRELRLLNTLCSARAKGAAYEQLFQQHRIFARRQKAVRRFLERFQQHHCQEFLASALQIDRQIKGIAAGNPWEGLALFCCRMA